MVLLIHVLAEVDGDAACLLATLSLQGLNVLHTDTRTFLSVKDLNRRDHNQRSRAEHAWIHIHRGALFALLLGLITLC